MTFTSYVGHGGDNADHLVAPWRSVGRGRFADVDTRDLAAARINAKKPPLGAFLF